MANARGKAAWEDSAQQRESLARGAAFLEKHLAELKSTLRSLHSEFQSQALANAVDVVRLRQLTAAAGLTSHPSARSRDVWLASGRSPCPSQKPSLGETLCDFSKRWPHSTPVWQCESQITAATEPTAPVGAAPSGPVAPRITTPASSTSTERSASPPLTPPSQPLPHLGLPAPAAALAITSPGSDAVQRMPSPHVWNENCVEIFSRQSSRSTESPRDNSAQSSASVTDLDNTDSTQRPTHIPLPCWFMFPGMPPDGHCEAPLMQSLGAVEQLGVSAFPGRPCVGRAGEHTETSSVAGSSDGDGPE